ncbi:MAG: DUF1598 domain-containing protein [Candidatus Saccharimonas sp.]|nr:DUF1598 domain-containing protein [Planctomycetaceae bacterium]
MFKPIRSMSLAIAVWGLLAVVGGAFVAEATAQNNNNNNQNNAGGIKIDAQGVVSLAIANEASGTLDKKRREAAAKKSLSTDITKSSSQRLVSLVRLEQQIDECLKDGKPIPDEVFFLAGLQRIDHIFVFPDDKDLVIAGPAEGFAPDAVGRMIGVDSGRPALRLDDLVVVLRTLIKSQVVGCSIDPVPERLANLQKFVQAGRPTSVAAGEARLQQMDDILGLQDVRVDGVPADSHFGLSLVEADYRMKRISLGLENPGVKGLKSHLAMIGANGNTLQRWWFVPLYDAIHRSEDGLAFQFEGQRVQLLSQEEMSDAQGNRAAASTTRLSTQAYAKQFTDKYPELAEKSPVFAELQNLIDLSVFAALVQQERLAEKAGWKMTTLLDEQRFGHPTFNAPKKIASLVNFKRAGSNLVGLVGGGVTIRPQQVLSKAASSSSSGQRLDSIRTEAASAKRSDTHPWWWDATH